jgi:carbon storage regulator CsrA
MLVLSRRIGEEIVIDEQIRVVVAAVKGDRVRLGICAPATVRVDRQEVHERRSLLPGSQRAGDEEVYPCHDKEDTQ